MRTGGQYQFKTADELRQEAQDYFDWCDKNPIRGSSTVSRDDGSRETRDTLFPRPYTFEGLGEHIQIADYLEFKKWNEKREGFADVFGWIRNKIRRNQIEGGLVGIYKENLTARLNGIAENMNDVTPPPSTIEIRFDE